MDPRPRRRRRHRAQQIRSCGRLAVHGHERSDADQMLFAGVGHVGTFWIIPNLARA